MEAEETSHQSSSSLSAEPHDHHGKIELASPKEKSPSSNPMFRQSYLLALVRLSYDGVSF